MVHRHPTAPDEHASRTPTSSLPHRLFAVRRAARTRPLGDCPLTVLGPVALGGWLEASILSVSARDRLAVVFPLPMPLEFTQRKQSWHSPRRQGPIPSPPRGRGGTFPRAIHQEGAGEGLFASRRADRTRHSGTARNGTPTQPPPSRGRGGERLAPGLHYPLPRCGRGCGFLRTLDEEGAGEGLFALRRASRTESLGVCCCRLLTL